MIRVGLISSNSAIISWLKLSRQTLAGKFDEPAVTDIKGSDCIEQDQIS
mgnify:FL=1|jgi:hypothetical protein